MGIVLQSAGSLTGALVTTLLAIAALAALGWFAVRLLHARGPRWGRRAGARLAVVERLPLDFKSSLYVVQGMGRTWLIGCGDGGGPRLIAELDAVDAAAAGDEGPTRGIDG